MASEKPSPTATVVELATITAREADETLPLMEQHGADVGELTPAAEKTLRWKLYLRLILLLIAIDLMLFIDKATLGEAAFLGIMEDAHLTDATYNDLNTIFYVGYAVGQVPGQLLIQKFPLGKFMAISIFLWAVIVFLHSVAISYGTLIPARFFLGVVESSLVPAMEVTMSMFLTPIELHAIQPIFWISCIGSSIPAGLIAYGLLWSTSPVSPWKFFMIITGGLTLVLAVLSWFVYPDNPATAKFLTIEERIHVIRSVRNATRSSIEQKQFKKYQLIEALRDPVTWLFALTSFCLMLANNLAFQSSLLYLALGVGNLDSTIITVVSGVFAVAIAIIASLCLRWWPGYGAYWATVWVLPAIAGSIGMIALPWSRKIGLLACLLLGISTWGMTYIISLVWASSSAAGHTKKLTRNAIFMAAYAISNIISPQLWVKGGPRYYGTWIAQTIVSFILTPAFLIIIRFILKRRNRERRAWIAEQNAEGNFGEGYVEETNAEGQLVKVKVDIANLDLTDFENKFFIYPL